MKKFLFLPMFLLFIIQTQAKEVILGGESIGIQINYEGLLITSTYTIDQTKYNPINDDIKSGDTLLEINGTTIETIEDFNNTIKKYKNNQVIITIQRDNMILHKNLKVFEINGNIKTGLFLKDEIAGIGTLTYIDPQTNKFAALGHEIIDQDTNEIILLHEGYLYPSSVKNIKKAQVSMVGEKQAQIHFNELLGDIHKINQFGVYGEINKINNNQTIETATQDEIIQGRAIMYTVLNEQTIEEIEIEITKIYSQSKPDIKSFEFKIIDQDVLIKTNGIIQGMSGSPIVQNNKLIGAVTHVSSKKPSNGYGLYIEHMLDE